MSMNMPERKSLTRLWAPKPMATPAMPAPAFEAAERLLRFGVADTGREPLDGPAHQHVGEPGHDEDHRDLRRLAQHVGGLRPRLGVGQLEHALAGPGGIVAAGLAHLVGRLHQGHGLPPYRGRLPRLSRALVTPARGKGARPPYRSPFHLSAPHSGFLPAGMPVPSRPLIISMNPVKRGARLHG